MPNNSDARISSLQFGRLAFYSLGFFRPKLWKRLSALGYKLSPFGVIGADAVLVWGRKPVSKRGIYMAKRKSLPLISIEDAFIRSVNTGWREAPAGLITDAKGIYFDCNNTSDFIDNLETASSNFDKPVVSELIERQIKLGLSKYNTMPCGEWVRKDYILVVDQVAGDASISHGGASAITFKAMLAQARINNPDCQIIIRTHPGGNGHFDESDLDDNMELSKEAANPWDVLLGAKDVYCVTSQMGFESILAGHQPYVYGKPFYAGWGLTHDIQPMVRSRHLSAQQLYYLAMIKGCDWFDAAGEPCDFETMLNGMEAKIHHMHKFGVGVAVKNIKAWKRPHMKRYFPNQSPTGISLRWGTKAQQNDGVIEDGFLRSRGLGARLVPPLSLIVDRMGIYFDPTRPSDHEGLVHQRANMNKAEMARAQNLRTRMVELGLSKYNLEIGPVPELPNDKYIILVPGQVEDDKSIILGATGDVKDAKSLLQTVRRQNPNAFIIYKPHPDVAVGLRRGLIQTDLADLVYTGGSLEPLWPHVDQLATITSQTGFEALLRGKKVSAYGMPFYADWGLTTDYAPSTGRRGKASLDQLVHATLIDYPIYYDPKARCISTPEIIAERLASGEVNHPLYLRAVTWVQQKAYRVVEFMLGKNR